MGTSQRLRDSDIRAMLHLMGEAGELRRDPIRCREHVLRGLCQLVGAPVGIWVSLEGLSRQGPPRFRLLMDCGWRDEQARAVVYRFLATGEPPDPMGEAMRRHVGAQGTRMRQQLIEDPAWYAQPGVSDARRAAGVDHCIYSGKPAPRMDGICSLSVHREWGGRPFGLRECRIVELVQGELDWLQAVDDTALAGAKDLPPRVRRVLAVLLQGASEKEAAQRLKLSPHSVHQYVKMLYRQLGVNSRGELMARWVGKQMSS